MAQHALLSNTAMTEGEHIPVGTPLQEHVKRGAVIQGTACTNCALQCTRAFPHVTHCTLSSGKVKQRHALRPSPRAGFDPAACFTESSGLHSHSEELLFDRTNRCCASETLAQDRQGSNPFLWQGTSRDSRACCAPPCNFQPWAWSSHSLCPSHPHSRSSLRGLLGFYPQPETARGLETQPASQTWDCLLSFSTADTCSAWHTVRECQADSQTEPSHEPAAAVLPLLERGSWEAIRTASRVPCKLHVGPTKPPGSASPPAAAPPHNHYLPFGRRRGRSPGLWLCTQRKLDELLPTGDISAPKTL